MIDPFEDLGREHKEIEAVLFALEHLGASAKDGRNVDVSDVGDLIAYLMDYGGLAHHEKEESILTPVLVRQGFDWSEEPLASVRREHRQVRYLIRSLFYLVKQEDAWSREDERTFANLALEYVAYSRRHMLRENGLFDMASKQLSAEAKRELAHRFEAFDAEIARSSAQRNAARRAERVVAKYPIVGVVTPSRSKAGCIPGCPA